MTLQLPEPTDTRPGASFQSADTPTGGALPPTDGVDSGQRDFRAKEVEGLSQGQIVRRRFFHHKGALISLIVVAAILLLSVSSIGWGFIPGWWKWKYTDAAVLPPNAQPTFILPFTGHGFRFAWGDAPFGSDTVGHDNFAQVMRGIQQTTVVVVILGVLSTVIGTVLGALAGYYRGWVESVIMRFTDLMITLPTILITAVLGYVLGLSGVLVVGTALGLLSWVGLTRLVRAEFLSLREREFVDAAKVAGASDTRIIFKHILPNTVGVIVVQMTLTMSGGILVEAGLSFLGFGIRFPDVSLGSLISYNETAMLAHHWWLFIWPGVFIVIIVLTLNFIGDGLRDAFDPRQRRVPKARDLRRPGSVLGAAEAATVAPVAEEIAGD